MIVSVVVMDCGLVLAVGGYYWPFAIARSHRWYRCWCASSMARWCGVVVCRGGAAMVRRGVPWCVMVSHGVVVGRRWCVVVCHGESWRGGGAAMVRQDKTVRETRDDSEMRRETRDAVVPRSE